jgi:predicted nuclease of restriction endonuclease-like (RecB) superfamily
MAKKHPPRESVPTASGGADYDTLLASISELLEHARHAAARSVNVVMTATYWEMGRRIVESEQSGSNRAKYGEGVLKRLATDLTLRFGRGFSLTNLKQFRKFFLVYSHLEKGQTTSDQLEQGSLTLPVPASPEASNRSQLLDLARRFPLPWSHYVQLLKVQNPEARAFYEAEALRNGWAGPQLERQITTLFYDRTLASRRKAAMLRKGAEPKPGEAVSPEEAIKDPLVLEFLGLKDEYSESDLEEALIRELESFLMELGGDFAFLGRQRRLRIGDEWYRIDLLFYHRRLRCLVIADLKLGKFTHADAGQMHLYLAYAQEHWTHPDENPPVGIILCTQKDNAVVHYALDTLPNKVLATEYRTTLPDEQTLVGELERTRKRLEAHAVARAKSKKH